MCKRLMYPMLLVFVLSLGLPGTTYGQLPDLVGWWKFDGDLRDSSGLGNHGIAGGSPTFVPGHIGSGALDLGGSDWVIIDAVGDDVTSAVFSIAIWVNSTQTGQGDIVALNNNASGHPFELYIAGGGNPGREDGGDINYPNAPTIGDGEWHHLAWVNDGSAAFIYVDGVEGATYTSALAGEFASVERWSVGQEYDSAGITSPSNFYTGQLDDLQIYNRPLTVEEIAQVIKGIPPGAASSPSPAHEESRVSRDATLGWEPGETAMTHNVYFGTTFADVNAASVDNPLGVFASQGQSDASYDPGRLEFGQTYHWRVDEVNGAPDRTVFAGSVWQFTVEPIADPIANITVTASDTFGTSGPENTVNGSGLVGDLHGVNASDMWISAALPAWIQYEFDRPHRLHELWVWNSNQLIEAILGFGAKEVVIEHSLNGTDWTVLEGVTELAQATGIDGAAASDVIDFGGAAAQYVRISINSAHGFVPQASLSEVRFLSIPTQAQRPSPVSGATDVAPDVPLAWGRDGREAGSHDVYVGTDADHLSLAGSVNGSSFDTTAVDLQLSQAYYWRVDEVNDAEDPSTWTGDLWSFSTADAIIIDDMESYRDEEQLEIWATWEDGFVDPDNNGALVGANPGIGNFAPESTIVHGGDQSLPIHYDNGAAAQSEATRTFAVSQDWTRAGATTLVVWFHGAAGNSGQLYLKVNGTKFPYDGPAGNIGLAAWQAWSIDLASLGNLQSVRSLAIGVEGNGASGTLHVDDITLVQSAPEPLSEWRVAASNDDGEEHILDGGVMESLTSSDLELGYEGDMSPPNLQTIGCRWVGVAVPQGATITEAYVQFSADSVGGAQHAAPVSLVIEGELSPNGGPFAATSGSVTGRQKTSASVVWDIPEWLTVHAQGPEERTPDISSIIQEIVNQPGWSGEAIVLMFGDNPANPSQGTREAESFDGGGASDAPLLVIRFE